MRFAAAFLAAALGCSSALRGAAPPPPECVEQVEVMLFPGTFDGRTLVDSPDPRQQPAERALDRAGIDHRTSQGGVVSHPDGTCEDPYTPRGPRCGWTSITVARGDAPRARAVLAARGFAVVPEGQPSRSMRVRLPECRP
jgi:hypothetical protein